MYHAELITPDQSLGYLFEGRNFIECVYDIRLWHRLYAFAYREHTYKWCVLQAIVVSPPRQKVS